jgi:cytochrome c peroxidase
MTMEPGARLPDATLLRFGPDGPQEVALRDLLAGRHVALFAVPGAYTPTCSAAHLPSFIRTADAFRAKGVAAILCVSVNDVHVMRHWGETSGATAAGIEMLADPAGTFTRAMGMNYDNPTTGLYGRSHRYALLAQDGVVTAFRREAANNQCDLTAGETLLADL